MTKTWLSTPRRYRMKIFLVAGARPNFMKVAPLMEALRARKDQYPELEPLLVHTGQHYDAQMSDEFFRDLAMPAPDIHLGAGSGTHAEQTARVIAAFFRCDQPNCRPHSGSLPRTSAHRAATGWNPSPRPRAGDRASRLP